jgi:hypothetical protein
MKTLQEYKNEVAIGRGYDSFNDFCRRQNFRLKIKVAYAIESLMDEAAELYAQSKLSALQQENEKLSKEIVDRDMLILQLKLRLGY